MVLHPVARPRRPRRLVVALLSVLLIVGAGLAVRCRSTRARRAADPAVRLVGAADAAASTAGSGSTASSRARGRAGAGAGHGSSSSSTARSSTPTCAGAAAAALLGARRPARPPGRTRRDRPRVGRRRRRGRGPGGGGAVVILLSLVVPAAVAVWLLTAGRALTHRDASTARWPRRVADAGRGRRRRRDPARPSTGRGCPSLGLRWQLGRRRHQRAAALLTALLGVGVVLHTLDRPPERRHHRRLPRLPAARRVRRARDVLRPRRGAVLRRLRGRARADVGAHHPVRRPARPAAAPTPGPGSSSTPRSARP